MKAGCATALVLNKWDLTGGDVEQIAGPGGGVGAAELDRERARVNRKLRLRPKVLTASAVDRPQRPPPAAGGALAQRSRARTGSATPELNRFLGEVTQARQPPAKQGHRLKMLYMAQIGVKPPRFSIQVNSRARLTRDYAYFVENRLRERYGLDGIPLVIDFAERKRRPRGESLAARRAGSTRRHRRRCVAIALLRDRADRRAGDPRRRRADRRHRAAGPARRAALRAPLHERGPHAGRPPARARRALLRRCASGSPRSRMALTPGRRRPRLRARRAAVARRRGRRRAARRRQRRPRAAADRRGRRPRGRAAHARAARRPPRRPPRRHAAAVAARRAPPPPSPATTS